MYTVLCISCHPDDMEVACAGTLLKCKARGDRAKHQEEDDSFAPANHPLAREHQRQCQREQRRQAQYRAEGKQRCQ